jgi:hypothetical protein
MYVVGHEYIGMNVAGMGGAGQLQFFKVEAVIGVDTEDF